METNSSVYFPILIVASFTKMKARIETIIGEASASSRCPLALSVVVVSISVYIVLGPCRKRIIISIKENLPVVLGGARNVIDRLYARVLGAFEGSTHGYVGKSKHPGGSCGVFYFPYH